jgi:hypothetical protein
MGIDCLIFSGDDVSHVAVAIGRVTSEPHNTHTGVVYRDLDGSLWMLHLGWHYMLLNWRYDGKYACVVPKIEPERARIVAGLCRTIWRRRPKIAYSLRLDVHARFRAATGDVVLTKNGNGLNCSNFVLVVFLTTGISLIDFATWRQRAEDADWHRYLVQQLEEHGASGEHIEAVRSEIGCARVRPEETAGASIEDALPATFEQCELNGRRIMEVLDARAKGTTSGSVPL